jgi:hypothetical protein
MDIPCISFFQEYAGEMCIVVLRRNKLFLLQHWPTDANSYGVTTLGDHTVKRQPKPFWGGPLDSTDADVVVNLPSAAMRSTSERESVLSGRCREMLQSTPRRPVQRKSRQGPGRQHRAAASGSPSGRVPSLRVSNTSPTHMHSTQSGHVQVASSSVQILIYYVHAILPCLIKPRIIVS